MTLTVRLLETGTGATSTILLRFTTARITDKKSSIVFNQGLSQVVLRRFINVLGVIRNNGFGNCRSNGVDLSSDTSTLYSYTDVKVGKLVLTKNQNWFKHLQSHHFGLDVLNWLTIDLDESPSLLCESNSSCRLFPAKGKEITLSYHSETKLNHQIQFPDADAQPVMDHHGGGNLRTNQTSKPRSFALTFQILVQSLLVPWLVDASTNYGWKEERAAKVFQILPMMAVLRREG